MHRPLQASARSWLPIASAPRDGSIVLIRFGNDGVSQARYVADKAHPWIFVDRHSDNVSWMLNRAVDGPGGPSHWQPMPDASVAISAQDAADEKLIVAKGKTAPRVTPAALAAKIASEHYFTALDGVLSSGGTGTLHHEFGDDTQNQALGLLTFCVLVLRNGFTVTGESACASPENFDAEIGRKIARDNALAKVWPLEGYLLKQRLFESA